MKLSKTTIDILKNFSTINNGMIINAGSRIRTIDNMSKQIAYADIEENFPVEFAVYDLGEFLQALNLISEPTMEFGEKVVTIYNDDFSLDFQYGKSEFISSAPETVNFPDDLSGGVQFQLTKEVLDKMLVASSTLGLPNIKISSEEGSTDVTISAVDVDKGVRHSFKGKTVVGTAAADGKFDFYFNASRLTIVKQDYEVSIHPGGISKFSSPNLEYYIATESV